MHDTVASRKSPLGCVTCWTLHRACVGTHSLNFLKFLDNLPIFMFCHSTPFWTVRHSLSLKRPQYLSSVDHDMKIRSRRQRMDIGKYSFVNRTIQHWDQLPAEVLGIFPCKQITFKKGVRKVIIELN